MSRIMLSLVLFLATVNAQTFYWGGCPTVKPLTSFSVSQFGNKIWYEHARTLNLYESTGFCPVSNIIVNGPNVIVNNVQIDIQNLTSRILTGSGSFPAAENTTAKIDIKYPTHTITYNVLSTDYTSNAAIYACVDYLFFSYRYLWIWSPNRFAPQTAIDTANATFIAQGLDIKGLNRTDTLFCPLMWYTP